MCSVIANNIVLFNVSGVPIKISTEKLAQHPESLLTTMVHDKVQPADGFFVECCPTIFGCILRFIIHDLQVDPEALAKTLFTSETHVRKVIDGFKFKGIYTNDPVPVVKTTESAKTTEVTKDPEADKESLNLAKFLYRNIWTVAEKGEIDNLRLIGTHNLDLDVACSFNGCTPLMYAARNGKLDCVLFLLEHGANVKAVNHSKLTALHFAVESNNTEVIRVLIKHGANVDAQSDFGYTPLYRAVDRNCKIETIKFLLENKANINIVTNDGMSPLHLASRDRVSEIVTVLLQAGANVNAKTQAGNTALHYASTQSLDIVKVLLKSGADYNVKNVNGEIPLIVASKSQKHDIVTELVSLMESNK